MFVDLPLPSVQHSFTECCCWIAISAFTAVYLQKVLCCDHPACSMTVWVITLAMVAADVEAPLWSELESLTYLLHLHLVPLSTTVQW